MHDCLQLAKGKVNILLPITTSMFWNNFLHIRQSRVTINMRQLTIGKGDKYYFTIYRKFNVLKWLSTYTTKHVMVNMWQLTIGNEIISI